MQKFDFTAPASGAPQVVNAPGRYLKYVSGTAGGNDTGLIVTPGGKPGSKVLLYPGQAITLPDDGSMQPSAWTIANAVGQATIAGTVVVGDGRLDDNTLQGVVQVVDGGKSRTLAGSAYLGYYYKQAGGANTYATVALLNPATSTTRIVVEQYYLSAGAIAVGAQYGIAAAANVTPALALVGGGGNKRSGGQASAGQVYQGAIGAGGLPLSYTFSLRTMQANGSTTGALREPLVLLPGYAFALEASVANADMGAEFEWYEEPNV